MINCDSYRQVQSFEEFDDLSRDNSIRIGENCLASFCLWRHLGHLKIRNIEDPGTLVVDDFYRSYAQPGEEALGDHCIADPLLPPSPLGEFARRILNGLSGRRLQRSRASYGTPARPHHGRA